MIVNVAEPLEVFVEGVEDHPYVRYLSVFGEQFRDFFLRHIVWQIFSEDCLAANGWLLL